MNLAIKKTLDKFQKDLKERFDRKIIDIVIYGSVIRGGFNSKKSDIDFIVFLNEELTEVDIVKIKELHAEYRMTRNLLSLLEGRYIAIDNNRFVNGYYVGTNVKGWKQLTETGFNDIEVAMILDSYLSLFMTNTISKLLHFDWIEIRNQICMQIEGFLNNELLLSDEGFKKYALITAARSLYTYLESGFISKNRAQQWIEHNFLKIDYQKPRECLIRIREIIRKNSLNSDKWRYITNN
ncbi:MAG: nucleotidyltransferase domain-containing protein [Candidatus Izemoplasmatales bacterium]